MDIHSTITHAAQAHLAQGKPLPTPNPITLFKACGGDGLSALDAAITLTRIRNQHHHPHHPAARGGGLAP